MSEMSVAEADWMEGFCLVLSERAIPAFGGEKGLWADYDAIAAAGITSFTCIPRLQGARFSATDASIDLYAEFDEGTFPHGLVYGDRQFQCELNRIVASLFGVGLERSFVYSEQGQQLGPAVHLESTHAFDEAVRSVSAHRWTRICADPGVALLQLDGNLLVDRQCSRPSGVVA